MTKEKQIIINNPHLHDSGGKLIFGDNILCSQFLRDYADMEILRNIRPEDIEDVSERYVLLYSSQRDSDTVKKVNISRYLSTRGDENPLGLPLYIVSLVEHKTKVEYNVCMQIFRYMFCIWDDYEKQMEKTHPGISARRDFRYPPILPIVYYEGTDRWTAPTDLADRILCKELLGDYLPHLAYQVVRLHDYSNEELLSKGDEISLAMLVNKIRSPEDVEIFTQLPKEKVDAILQNTPAYLLEVMAKLARALFYNMDIPEDKTEEAVAKIKERKMGKLFEGITFDYQAEMRKMREATEAAEQKSEAAQRDIEAARRKSEAAQQQIELAEQKSAEAEQKSIEAEQKSIEAEQKSIEAQKIREEADQRVRFSSHMIRMALNHHTASEIKNSLMQEFGLTKEEAEEEYRRVTE